MSFASHEFVICRLYIVCIAQGEYNYSGRKASCLHAGMLTMNYVDSIRANSHILHYAFDILRLYMAKKLLRILALCSDSMMDFIN